MGFGIKALPTRKYAYGVSHRPHGKGHKPNTPFPGQDAAIEQLFKANRFQNTLVEIELARRKAYKDILHKANPGLDTLEAAALALESEIDALRSTLGKKNSEARTKGSDSTLAALIKEKDDSLSQAWNKYTAAKKVTAPTVKEEANASSAVYTARAKAARKVAVKDGLYWGTAANVETRVEKTGMPPKFKKWAGEGLIACQLQAKPGEGAELVPVLKADGTPQLRKGKPLCQSSNYKPFTEVEARQGNTLIKIEATENTRYVNVHLRIASNKSKPVWAVLPVIWHRDLEKGVNIKWAYLIRKKIGCYFRWEVQFDLSQKAWEPRHERATTGTVAVALGWRKIDGALRVGSWIGSDGETGEIVIPEDRVNGWINVDTLQSIRDTNFDGNKDALSRWLATQTLSEEWKKRTEHLGKWKSPARLAKLVLWWRDNRIPGDDAIYSRLEGELVKGTRDSYTGGRKQDKHLYNYQESSRTHLRAWRKDYYRCLAVELGKRYRDVVFAEINWANLGEQPELESPEEKVYQRYKGVASVGKLRDTLIQYMSPVELSPVNVTRTCNRCGTVCESPGAGRWVTCETCGGIKIDRAENAARNLLRHALGEPVAV